MFCASVFVRQQDSGDGAVSLRDDVELVVGEGVIDREEPASVFEGLLVGRFVFVIEIAPVARKMATKGKEHFGAGNRVECSGSRDQLTQLKFWFRWVVE